MIFRYMNAVLIALCLLHLSKAEKAEFVSCGTALKLLNVKHKVRLHSHDVKYGSGSGQQSVTGTNIAEDVNSFWVVRGPNGTLCTRGESIKCGNTIVLQHLSSTRNLHSHYFKSPLSNFQEISCYGDNGVGDTGDNWEVICPGKYWRRDDKITLRHIDTNAYLCATEHTYGRPITDQHEVAGGYRVNTCGTEWKAAEGVFVKKGEFDEFTIGEQHDPAEL